MKKIIFTISFLIGAVISYNAFAQNTESEKLKKVYDSEHDESYMVGEYIDYKALKNELGFESIDDIQKIESLKQTPGLNRINELNPLLKDIQVVVVIGTWCDDSKLWTPDILNILNASGLPQEQLKIYALDRNKKGLNSEEKTYRVEYVPTVIFIKDNQEIGRFVESPETNIVEDFIKILSR